MHQIRPTLFHKVKKLIEHVDFNTFFAMSVIENHVTGQVFADDVSDPKAAYIRHPYGMSLLVGGHANKACVAWLCDYISGRTHRRSSDDWMQVFPFEWNRVIEREVSKNGIDRHIEKCTRVNFSFNVRRYAQLKKQLDFDGSKIEKMNRSQFMAFEGTVTPRRFWDRFDDLDEAGSAYAVIESGDTASIAFASYVHGNNLEFGIETAPAYRRRGYAIKACARLIDHCLSNRLEPVWSCKLENGNSYGLATKLGFDETARYPYYGLMNSNPGNA
jgi:RimJ/RimL family protein N-acetyltransferase